MTEYRRRALAGLMTLALAGALLVAGPLATPAHAATVASAAEYRQALDDIVCEGGTGEHLIEITADFELPAGDNQEYLCDDDLVIRSTPGERFTVTSTAGGSNRLLYVWGGTGASITVEHLRLVSFVGSLGATLHVNSESLRLDHVVIENGTGVSSAGVYAAGTDVTVVDSQFIGNTSVGGGGAIFCNGCTLNVTDSLFDDNSASLEGGAIFSVPGRITLERVTFTNNLSGSFGGAVSSNSVGQANRQLEMTDTVFIDNSALQGGGAYVRGANNSLTVEGGQFTGNSATADGGAIFTLAGADLSVTETVFELNTAQARGGAIHAGSFTPVGIVRAVFTANDAGTDGGAIHAQAVADFAVAFTEFVGNTAGGDGGAISGADSTIVAYASTFDNNSADGNGGAISVLEAMALVNNTLVDNSATTGGALHADEGDVVVISSSLSGNTATSSGGAIWADGATEEVLIMATVLAGGPAADDCDLASGTVDVSSSWARDTSCGLVDGVDGNLVAPGGDPMLTELTDNGGITRTLAPEPGSPLIDAVALEFLCNLNSEDQRGATRPSSGTVCDIGAVEARDPITFDVVTSNGTITVTLYNADGVSGVGWIAAGDLDPAPPADVLLPYGGFTFTAEVPHDPNAAAGWPITVVAELPAPVTQWWKLQGGTWFEVADADIAGTTVTFSLRDGAVGDADGVRNGEIDDPSAPGIGAAFTG